MWRRSTWGSQDARDRSLRNKRTTRLAQRGVVPTGFVESRHQRARWEEQQASPPVWKKVREAEIMLSFLKQRLGLRWFLQDARLRVQ